MSRNKPIQRTVTTELPMDLWEFAADSAKLVAPARLEYLNRTLAGEAENIIVRELQPKYGINKRQVNAIRSEVKGAIASAKECRKDHIKTLQRQNKSIEDWLKDAEKDLAKLPNACSARFRHASLRSQKKFAIHHKKRKLYQLQKKLEHVQSAPLKVSLGNKVTQYTTVGSTGESFGNQIAQYDGYRITFRVPYALEPKYGKYTSAPLMFEYEVGQKLIKDAIQANRALSYRLYCKDFRWFIACSTELVKERHSFPRQYGCIGIDINPGVIGWAFVDRDGNLKHHGQFKLNVHSRRSNQISATVHDVTKQLVTLANTFQCPIAVEELDFSGKKSQLKEQGKRYARMLSGFIYGRITELVKQKCESAGIELITRNPAYSSLIGLVKFMRQYGLSSDTAAAMVLARRAMGLSERVPNHVAYPGVKAGKHVWSAWYSLNKMLKSIPRHQYYTLANSQLEVTLLDESSMDRFSSKLKGTSKRGENPQRNRSLTVRTA